MDNQNNIYTIDLLNLDDEQDPEPQFQRSPERSSPDKSLAAKRQNNTSKKKV
jgi:hypothetical protein